MTRSTGSNRGRPAGKDACPTILEVEAMESPLSFFRMRWDHEPVEIPLTRPSDTLSPSGGEGRGEGVRWFTERKA